MKTAAAVNHDPTKPVFKYTSHSFLIDFFFNCPTTIGASCGPDDEAIARASNVGVTPWDHPGCVICPNASEVAAMRQAIADGIITWHAFPLNAEPELADASLFESGLASVHALDDAFKVPRKTVMSQRDVPGVTRSVIPLLKKHGVVAFSEGCNGQVEAPQVPSIFNWTDPLSGESIVMLLHPRGYGGTQQKTYDAETERKRAIFDDEYLGLGAPNLCPDLTDSVTVPGFNEALIYAFKPDNQGPHNPMEATIANNCVKKLFPGAEVVGSTYDAFLEGLLEHGTEALPLVTQEMGDTWIYGMQADHLKAKTLRVFQRHRTQCLSDGACDPTSPQFLNFSRLLIKPIEHTFGIHGLGVQTGWTNANLTATLADPGPHGSTFRNATASWSEQRAFFDYALTALDLDPQSGSPNHALASAIRAELTAAQPAPVSLVGLTKVDTAANLTTEHFRMTLAPSGGLASLVTLSNGREWVASPDEPLFSFSYQTANQMDDFQYFRQNYTQGMGRGTCYDKVGLDNETCSSPMGCAESKFWPTTVVAAYASSTRVVMHVQLVDVARAHTLYGSPSDVWIDLSMPSDAPSIQAALSWFNKTSTRIPESYYFDVPITASGSTWQVDKLGQFVDTADVMPGGGVRMHAVGPQGARLAAGTAMVSAIPIDSGLVSIATKSTFPTPLNPLDRQSAGGPIYFVLQNNYWDVNYPMWYPFDPTGSADRDALFRFNFTFSG